MNFEKFAVWLSGFADLNMGKVPDKEQWDLIVERLAETFDEPAGPALRIEVGTTGAHTTKHTGGYVDPKFGMWGGSEKNVTTLEARTANATSDAHDNAITSRINGLSLGVTSREGAISKCIADAASVAITSEVTTRA